MVNNIKKAKFCGKVLFLRPTFLRINTEETQTLSQSAREAIRPIFTFESNRAEQAIQSFRISWEKLVKHGSNTNSNAKANVQNEEKSEIHWTGAAARKLEKFCLPECLLQRN